MEASEPARGTASSTTAEVGCVADGATPTLSDTESDTSSDEGTAAAAEIEAEEEDHEELKPKPMSTVKKLRTLLSTFDVNLSGGDATRARDTLPVFFDKDGRAGPSAAWWRDAYAISAALDRDKHLGGASTVSPSTSEAAHEAADLGRAAEATFEIAQRTSRTLLLNLHGA